MQFEEKRNYNLGQCEIHSIIESEKNDKVINVIFIFEKQNYLISLWNEDKQNLNGLGVSDVFGIKNAYYKGLNDFHNLSEFSINPKYGGKFTLANHAVPGAFIIQENIPSQDPKIKTAFDLIEGNTFLETQEIIKMKDQPKAKEIKQEYLYKFYLDYSVEPIYLNKSEITEYNDNGWIRGKREEKYGTKRIYDINIQWNKINYYTKIKIENK